MPSMMLATAVGGWVPSSLPSGARVRRSSFRPSPRAPPASLGSGTSIAGCAAWFRPETPARPQGEAQCLEQTFSRFSTHKFGVNVRQTRLASQSLACLPENTTDATASDVSEAGDASSGAEVDRELNCIGTGMEVTCSVDDGDLSKLAGDSQSQVEKSVSSNGASSSDVDAWTLGSVLGLLGLISPFFFWGTSMVAMKEVLPDTGPFFVAAVRLLPAGALVVAYAALQQKRSQPSSAAAWLAIALFGLVDGTVFQGCLAEGLRRTPAGLGSVIIDSQPITVTILASLIYGESIGATGVVGLLIGVLGLCLLELPPESVASMLALDWDGLVASFAEAGIGVGGASLWESGEWWMLLAAQSMAVGTLMVRWVSKYCDPVMATGWHMIIGGVPLLALSLLQEPQVYSSLGSLEAVDYGALAYTSVLGSAVSYGTFFYFASKGNLSRLSALTFLTPLFAASFGYLLIGETLTTEQLIGGGVILAGVTLANTDEKDPTVE